MELPTTQVIFWDLTNETEEQVTITKRQSEIIIATSDYSMSVAKTNIELGKGLIANDKFEKVPLYVTDADLFYDADITLKDLNGNIVKKELLMSMFQWIPQTVIGNGLLIMSIT